MNDFGPEAPVGTRLRNCVWFSRWSSVHLSYYQHPRSRLCNFRRLEASYCIYISIVSSPSRSGVLTSWGGCSRRRLMSDMSLFCCLCTWIEPHLLSSRSNPKKNIHSPLFEILSSSTMADDDFDLYGEDDGFGNPPSQVQVGYCILCSQSRINQSRREKRWNWKVWR